MTLGLPPLPPGPFLALTLSLALPLAALSGSPGGSGEGSPSTFVGPPTAVAAPVPVSTAGGPPAPLGAGSTSVPAAFDNGSCETLFWAAPAPNEAWMDFGVKATGLSGIVTGATLGYVTTSLDADAGGAGAAFGFELRAGATGFGDVGTVVTSLSFTGLPGSPDGVTPTAYALQIDLSGSVACIPDGPLGWAFLEQGDAGSTGPILTQVGGCPSGTLDGVDAYFGPPDPANYMTTFTFGQPDIASFSLTLDEDDGSTVASATPRNTTNPPGFSVQTLPVLCSTVDCTVVLDPGGQPISIVAAGAPDLQGTPSFFGTGDLLISLIPAPVLDIATGSHVLPVPPKAGYIGQTITVQGFRIGPAGSIDALNAVDLVIGT